jgi:hypothetical protein
VTLDLVRTVIAIAAVLITFAFSIWLWWIGTRGSTARQLSVLLAVEGFTLASSSTVLDPYLSPHVSFVPLVARLWVHHTFDVALIALYPPFLANALRTRWTLPFAKKPVQIVLALIAVALVTFVMTGGPEPYERRVALLYLVMCLVFVFAFAAAFHAWRVATSETQRRSARAFVIGFGLRDVCWCIVYGSGAFFAWSAQDPFFAQLNPLRGLLYAFGTLLEVPLIAYAILSTRLFDIDLRVKWTVRQSTLAAIVIAIVYFTTEAADRLLSQELGAWPGLAAAALIVYLLAPLQRLSERVANHVMPKTVSTPEYLAYRKMQIYEAALTEALGGDGISDKERAILTRLRESLEVSHDDARAMEDQLLARRAARVAVSS